MKKLYAALLLLSCLTCVRAEESDTSGEQLPPPEKKELKMNELRLAMDEMDGKIVKTIISGVSTFDVADRGRYYAYCGYYGSDSFKTRPSLVLVPAEGKDFFMSLAKNGLRGDGLYSVYCRIHSKSPVQAAGQTYSFEAVGNRYDDSKNVYCWAPASESRVGAGPSSKKIPEKASAQKITQTSSADSTTPPPPEKKEMRMDELKAQILDLDGKVVETIINHVYSFEQVDKRSYRAWCSYWGSGSSSSESVLIPEEGKEFFQNLAKQDNNYGGGGEKVYLRVHSKNPVQIERNYPLSLEAVGTRYSKSKGEYSW